MIYVLSITRDCLFYLYFFPSVSTKANSCKGVVPNEGLLYASPTWNIWECLETFLVATLAGVGDKLLLATIGWRGY